MLKVGIVGLGKMGLLHAGILNFLPNVKISAVCDKSRLILNFSKKVFEDVNLVNDIQKLSRYDLDLVYVTTPIFSHYPITKSLFLEGITKNVFVEKTLGSSYEEAQDLCNLAKESKGVNMVGFMKRFAVTFNKAKNLLSEGILGDITSFKASAFSSDFLGKRNLKKTDSTGGDLRDLGSHAIDLAHWFFGDFQVDDFASKTISNSENSSFFNVKQLDLAINGSFHVSRCMQGYRMPEISVYVRGSNGSLNVNDDQVILKLNSDTPLVWYRHDLQDKVDFLLGGSEYFREDQLFVNSIINSKHVESDFPNAAKVDFIIDQVMERNEN